MVELFYLLFLKVESTSQRDIFALNHLLVFMILCPGDDIVYHLLGLLGAIGTRSPNPVND
jgi:hypothetical protein